MRKFWFFLVAAMFFSSGIAWAKAERIPVSQLPSRSGETVTIGTPLNGWVLLNVQRYDDEEGTQPDDLGPVTSFTCRPERGEMLGQGFNFTARKPNCDQASDPDRCVRWQMINPGSKTGPGVSVDPSNEGGSKYYCK